MAKPSEDGVFLRVSPDGFSFASEYDKEITSGKYAVGTVVRADIHKPRSGKQNRWYRALVRAVWKHQDHYKTPEALHMALKVRLGYIEHFVLHNGEMLIVPKSTAYDKMDHGEFNQFVEQTWLLIQQEIIPGLDAAGKRGILTEIDGLIGSY